jgi:energy-coupling factor transporter ATP-binding protein EcfA2
MRLISARVRDFQAFSDSGSVDFLEGINLVIGQNNAGKSTLLRALLPSLPDDRHRTPGRWETFRLGTPQVDLTVEAEGSEIHDWALQSNNQHHFPLTVADGEKPQYMDAFFDEGSCKFEVNRRAGASFTAKYPSHGLFVSGGNTPKAFATLTSSNGELLISRHTGSNDTLAGLLWEAWVRDMFYFAPERMTVGEAGSGWAARLLPNASNLPNVLHTLNNERGDVFGKLVFHLREVFPTVGNLSVRSKPENNNLEVRVWPTKAMERVELSFPLNASGTGVSQIIALLTAVMTIDNAVVIIDEINSFLHPAAVKALLRILQTQYSQHQYIISTHAPEVIGFSNPSTVHLVRRAGYESTIHRLDLTQVGEFREVAEHLGVSMADVFAADRVIWVEGATEELCFPYLHQQCVGPMPRGTVVTSVAATGDFSSKKRDPALVFEIYRRLSAATATLAVSVAFSFDTEKLTDEEKKKMQRDSAGSLHFLPRRHLECYFVDPSAIAAFIVSKDTTMAGSITPAAVEAALRRVAAEQPLHIPEWTGDIADVAWLARVDAARLISNVCGELSEQRAQFNKKADTLFLMRHAVEHDRDRLAPLVDYVRSLFPADDPP